MKFEPKKNYGFRLNESETESINNIIGENLNIKTTKDFVLDIINKLANVNDFDKNYNKLLEEKRKIEEYSEIKEKRIETLLNENFLLKNKENSAIKEKETEPNTKQPLTPVNTSVSIGFF